jgi:riboflavin kinase/FMN adenylyltransferase
VAVDPDSGLSPDVVGTVATVGTFDGVHLGHQDVLRRLAARAQALGLRSVLVTFAGHPLELLRPDAAPLQLTPGREKLEAIAPTGIDYVAVLPFTRVLAGLDADAFVDRVLLDGCGCAPCSSATTTAFGRTARATPTSSGRSAPRAVSPSSHRARHRRRRTNRVVDRSAARPSAEGELEAAAAMLGRRYWRGRHVVRGEAAAPARLPDAERRAP